MDDKDPQAFRTISEAAEELDLPQHVLRFWESRFREIKPMKRGGGRRFYRPEDLDLLRGIKHLLYGEGYTIRGVQRILREQGIRFVQAVWEEGAEQPAPADADADQAGERADDAVSFEQDEGIGARLGSLIGRDLGARAEGRRVEPSLSAAPAPQLGPAVRATQGDAPPRQPASNGLDREQREALQAVLDELLACRKLIDAAVARTE